MSFDTTYAFILTFNLIIDHYSSIPFYCGLELRKNH